MAKLKAFVIYDSKVETYDSPFVMRTTAEAQRAFSELCSERGGRINKHPEDYSLFEIAAYDDTRGMFEPLTAPVHLANAVQYARTDAARAMDGVVSEVFPQKN